MSERPTKAIGMSPTYDDIKAHLRMQDAEIWRLRKKVESVRAVLHNSGLTAQEVVRAARGCLSE